MTVYNCSGRSHYCERQSLTKAFKQVLILNYRVQPLVLQFYSRKKAGQILVWPETHGPSWSIQVRSRDYHQACLNCSERLWCLHWAELCNSGYRRAVWPDLEASLIAVVKQRLHYHVNMFWNNSIARRTKAQKRKDMSINACLKCR